MQINILIWLKNPPNEIYTPTAYHTYHPYHTHRFLNLVLENHWNTGYTKDSLNGLEKLLYF